MRTLLDRLPGVTVAVIGDVMLDCYVQGDVSRISPEAPVPVLRATSERVVSGGAANVAANLAALDVAARVVGLCGDDDAYAQLATCLSATGRIDCTGLVTTPARRTTRKMRIIGTQQQIVRIDHEDALPCDATLQARCIAAARAAIDRADAVVLSDYAKGVCSDALVRAVIEHAAAEGKPVLVDPKRRDPRAPVGADVVRARGGRVVHVEPASGHSTSRLASALDGQWDDAGDAARALPH